MGPLAARCRLPTAGCKEPESGESGHDRNSGTSLTRLADRWPVRQLLECGGLAAAAVAGPPHSENGKAIRSKGSLTRAGHFPGLIRGPFDGPAHAERAVNR